MKISEEEVEHTVIYQGRNYDKIYLPVFLRFNKEKLLHYRYIKTINAGSTNAHILQGGNEYFMCLSKDEYISAEERTMEPMGFRKNSIEVITKYSEVPYISVDRTEIQQVFINMIINAMDAMIPKGGLLEITVNKAAAGNIEIRIKDMAVKRVNNNRHF